MDALAASQAAKDTESFEQHNVLGRDIAKVLRHNIVQANRVKEAEDGSEIYRALFLCERLKLQTNHQDRCKHAG